MQTWHYEIDGMPLGPMCAAFDERGRIRQLYFGGLDPRATTPLAPKSQREAFQFLHRQVEAYFTGKLQTFTVPLAPQGTEFQLKVWDQLVQVPFGRTVSYQQLAERLGMPEGAQAVGGAVAANPIMILIPCHRVVGSDGSLTGYAGGKEKKAFLLDLERGGRPGLQPELGLF